MKINKIKINGFGNLENKEIDFKEHINLIYGKNEAGKSTLLKFIISMFYGVSKNKRGKDISDIEKYKPWNQADFSGKLSYELANGESYEIFREFQKKSPKLFNKEMEDIAGSYSSDKTKGNEFFFEQTKIDEELFTSSLASLQTQTKIELQDQNLLIQKITNLVSTGDDSVSYQKIIDKLNKKQTEEIGTEKTKGRPINIICERLQEIDRQQKELKQYENSRYEIQEQKQKIQEELKRELIELEVVKKLKEMEEQNSIEKEKIKLSQEFLDNLEKNMVIKRQ
ncbi:MAG: ATP-binding protein, partial [Clostridia bacterium]